jgi:NADP-reducing hydrogenase subunit HndB
MSEKKNPTEIINDLKSKMQMKIYQDKYAKKSRIYYGDASCENAAGAVKVKEKIISYCSEKNLDNVYIGKIGCSGKCDFEPMMQVIIENETPYKYCQMTPEKVEKVIDEHIVNGNVVEEFLLN